MALQMSNAYVAERINAYKGNEIMAASPGDLVLMLYDQAILGCKASNREKASMALAELVNSLNFDYEISTNLFRLYDYALRMVKKEKFNEVIKLLSELRDAWETALQNQMAA